MNSLRVFVDRKMVYLVAIFALLLSTVLPIFASAAQLADRSIELSSSTKAATGVQYKVTFTAAATAGAAVINFCSNTPLVGEVCTAPTGLSASSATVTDATLGTGGTVNKVVVTDSIAVGVNTFTINNITNPTNAGALYARVLTYADQTAANGYTTDDSTTAIGSPIDQGSIALSITDGIGVSGAVLENMVFCVSAAAPTANCGGVSAPTLVLGEDVGAGVKALGTNIATAGNSGDIFTQLSTNAVGGAVVSLKSSADCGGLKRAGAAVCDIAPAVGAGGIVAGEAKFGVKVAAEADPSGVTPSGTFQADATSGYNDTDYRMNWVSGNLSGVGSTYGDPIMNTNSAPVNNKNMKLTFGAQINNMTPAGKYSAELSLVATGKF